MSLSVYLVYPLFQMPATQQSFDTIIINNSVSLMSKCLDLFLSEYLVAAVTWLVEIKLSPKWLTKMKVCCRTCSRVATDSLIKIRHRRIRISKALTPMAVKITGVYVNNITGSYPAAVCMIYLFIYYWYIYFCFSFYLSVLHIVNNVTCRFLAVPRPNNNLPHDVTPV